MRYLQYLCLKDIHIKFIYYFNKSSLSFPLYQSTQNYNQTLPYFCHHHVYFFKFDYLSNSAFNSDVSICFSYITKHAFLIYLNIFVAYIALVSPTSHLLKFIYKASIKLIEVSCASHHFFVPFFPFYNNKL